MAGYYPVVAVTGPRQSGKTTFCQATFPNRPYVSMEPLDTRDFAHSDPRGFLAQYGQGAIFDEIQHVPELMHYLQSEVDARPIRAALSSPARSISVCRSPSLNPLRVGAAFSCCCPPPRSLADYRTSCQRHSADADWVAAISAWQRIITESGNPGILDVLAPWRNCPHALRLISRQDVLRRTRRSCFLGWRSFIEIGGQLMTPPTVSLTEPRTVQVSYPAVFGSNANRSRERFLARSFRSAEVLSIEIEEQHGFALSQLRRGLGSWRDAVADLAERLVEPTECEADGGLATYFEVQREGTWLRYGRAPRLLSGLGRWVYQGLGYGFLGLSIIGVAGPFVPTTPSVLLSSYFFVRSSPALKRGCCSPGCSARSSGTGTSTARCAAPSGGRC